MTRSLRQIKDDSRNALAGNYMLYFVVLIITALLTTTVNQLLAFFSIPLNGASFGFLIVIDLIMDCLVMTFSKMLQAGQYFLSLNIARFNRVSISDLFLAFRYDTGKAAGLSAILGVIDAMCTAPFMVALSYLVYMGVLDDPFRQKLSFPVIIGILAGGLAGMIVLNILIAFPFSQALFLYIDHQEYTAKDCLMNSITLMKGQFLNYLKLHLSLAGYYALCLLSLGLGVIWVLPYQNVIRANFYMSITGTYKPY